MATDTRSDEVIRLHNQGMSFRAIAARMGRSMFYVRTIIEKTREMPVKKELTPYEYAYRNWERAKAGARQALNNLHTER